ncbi:MAG: O-methyltransferase [Myxococcota bacterium]
MADAPKHTPITPELHGYLVAHGAPPDPVQRALIEETARLGRIAMMQIAPEQGAFMSWLARTLGAKRVVEVGTFTGYSTLCLARGLPDDGRVLALDVSSEWTAIGRRHWEKAGLAHKIELRIGPALETLRALPREAVFDLAFIDADKTGYAGYVEEILPRLRTGGVILVDNVLWGGAVVDARRQDADTLAIRAFNDSMARDPRVDAVMIPLSDGLTLLRKR